MACERYDDLLQEHLDHSLSRAEEDELQAHLKECSRCRRDAVLYGAVVSTLDELRDADAPSDAIVEGVRVALEREPALSDNVVAFPALRRASWAWGVMAAAAVAFMALGAHLADQAPSVRPAPRPPMVANAQLEPASQQVAVVPRRFVGRVVVDGGAVSVLRAGGSAWERASGEVQLAMGDRVRSESGAEAILYYENRGRMTLKPNTDLQIIERGLRVRSGATWIKIAKRGEGFCVETPNAVAAVRGTMYSVEVAEMLPPATTVNVFGGVVEVRAGTIDQPLGEAVLVAKDEAVQVCGQVVADKAPIQLAAYHRFGMEAPAAVEAGATVPTVVDVVTPPAGPEPGAAAGDGQPSDVTGSVQLLEGTEDAGEDGGPASSAAVRPRH